MTVLPSIKPLNKGTLLILGDGKPGHVNQSLAFASLLGFPHELVTLRFRNRFCKLVSYLLDRLGLYWKLLLRMPPLKNNSYSAVVSAGSETYYGAKLMARSLRIPALAIMLPRGYRYDFDLILAQEHDAPPQRPNLLTLPVNLCKAEPQGVFTPETGIRYVALVIGGPNSVFHFDPAVFSKVLDSLFSAFEGYSLVVATSRRTPAEVDAMLQRYPFAARFIYSMDPANPIPDFTGTCDYICITADSTSMISEAVTSGRSRVEVIPLPFRGKPGKYGRMLDLLEQRGCVHRFVGVPGEADSKIDLAALLREAGICG